MGATLTTADAIMKELYTGTVQKQLNSEIKTLTRIERSSEGVTSEVGGKYVTFPIHYQRNSGVGSRAEMGTLPTPGNQGTVAARVGLKYHYGAVQLSGQTMELVKTNAQAFMSALDLEVNGIKDDVKKDYNRQVYGTTVGKVATATAGATSATITVGSTQYLQVGMKVDLVDDTDDTTLLLTNVTVVSFTATTVTLSSSSTHAVGDYLVRTGNLDKEITGLESIVSESGTLYNVDPASYQVWKSSVTTAVGALSEAQMTEMVDEIAQNGGNTTVIFTTPGVRRAYANLLTQQRRYAATTSQKFTGGFSGLAFTTDEGDIPVVSDFDCPSGLMYFLNEKDIKVYREGDWSWMDRDGSMWVRTSGKDAYEATLFQYSELGIHRRNTHGLLSGVTEE